MQDPSGPVLVAGRWQAYQDRKVPTRNGGALPSIAEPKPMAVVGVRPSSFATQPPAAPDTSPWPTPPPPPGLPSAHRPGRSPPSGTACPTTAISPRSWRFAALPPARHDAPDETAATPAPDRPTTRTTPEHSHGSGSPETAAAAPATGTAAAECRSAKPIARNHVVPITSSSRWFRSSDQNVI